MGNKNSQTVHKNSMKKEILERITNIIITNDIVSLNELIKQPYLGMFWCESYFEMYNDYLKDILMKSISRTTKEEFYIVLFNYVRENHNYTTNVYDEFKNINIHTNINILKLYGLDRLNCNIFFGYTISDDVCYELIINVVDIELFVILISYFTSRLIDNNNKINTVNKLNYIASIKDEKYWPIIRKCIDYYEYVKDMDDIQKSKINLENFEKCKRNKEAFQNQLLLPRYEQVAQIN